MDPSSPFALVPAPAGVVYRVGRRNSDLWSPRPWSKANNVEGGDGTFGNRFDDPGKTFNPPIPQEHCFRVIYAATTVAAAVGETIASLRPSLEALDKAARDLKQTGPDA